MIPILLAFGEITHFEREGEGGGCDSLIKVGTDVQRVQNLSRAQFPRKTFCLGKKSVQKPNDGASFHDF